MLTIGSLFAGYGGLDRATEVAFGARTAWVSEIDTGACKVLAHRFPGVPNHGDITRIDWASVEPVDIITGGSPCQDLSTAGRRAGMTDGTRSNLWVQMREAIAHVQPTYVVWENVRGSLSAEAASDLEHCPGCMGSPDDRGTVLRALGRVLGDLADLGFDAEWRGLRASDVGACHQRFRIFVLAWRRDAANPYDAGLQGQRDPQGAAQAERHGHAEPGAGGPDLVTLPTPSANLGDNGGPQHPDKRRAGGHSVTIEDAIHGLAMLPTPRATDGAKGGPNQRGSSGDLMLPSAVAQLLPTPRVSQAGYADDGRGGKSLDVEARKGQFGQYAAAVARQEAAFGHRAPSPTEPGKNRPRLAARFCEWMMGLPPGWITDVPGVTRNEALRMAGNGVVPQQAHAALLDMLPHATAPTAHRDQATGVA